MGPIGRVDCVAASQPAPETKGWIGERFDAGTGLQYLNARYFDPFRGMLVLPGWFDVIQPGVGTNGLSYAFHDLVHRMDPKRNDAARALASVGSSARPVACAAASMGFSGAIGQVGAVKGWASGFPPAYFTRSGRPETASSTSSARAATCWFSRPCASRKRRARGLSGTTPMPISLLTSTTGLRAS